jgi:hypothetical protein
MTSALVQSITENELAYISAADYGQDARKHLDALHEVIFRQGGKLQGDQHWFPYEVVELVAHAGKAGHEREFAICTLLVIEAVVSGFDTMTDLAEKFDERARDYDALPEQLRNEILSAYRATGIQQ